MDVVLSKDVRDFLKETYPQMSQEDSLKAFIRDSKKDRALLDRAAERIADRRDLIWSLVWLSVVILWSFWYFT